MKSARIPWFHGSLPAWRSLDQFSVLWGLSTARTSLAIEALVRAGRMESRQVGDQPLAGTEYRIVAR